MSRTATVSVALLMVLLISSLLASASSFPGYKVIKTPHATVFFREGYEKVAKYVARVFEAYRQKTLDLVGHDPGQITFVVADVGTVCNGMASAKNTIYILVWPPTGLEAKVLNTESWFREVVTHEFTHECHLTYLEGLPAILSSSLGSPMFLGGIFNPQVYTPFVESTTVFAESQNSPYEGRRNNPLVLGLQKSLIKSGNFPSIVYASVFPDDEFPGSPAYYLIPSGFYEWLSKKYGHDKVKKFLKKNASRFVVFGFGLPLDGCAREAFGKGLYELWTEWVKGQKKEASGWEYPGKEIFSGDDVLIRAADTNGRNLYAIVEWKGPVAHLLGTSKVRLVEVDPKTGKVREICPINGHVLSFKVVDDSAFFLRPEENVWELSDIAQQVPPCENAIWVKDLKTGKERRLKVGKITAFDVYKGQLLLAYYDPKGFSSKVVLCTDGGPIELVKLRGYVKEMAVSNGGKIALLVSEEGHIGKVLLLDAGTGKMCTVLDDPFYKFSLTWEDDRNLVYCAGYDLKFADIYRVNVDTGKVERLTKGGYFFEVAVVKRGIFAAGFSTTKRGMAIYEAYTEPVAFSVPSARPVGVKLADVPMREANPAVEYLQYTLTPIGYIPLVIPKEGGGGMLAGVGLFGSDPHLRVIWAAVPLVDTSTGSLFGGAYVQCKVLPPLTVSLGGYRLPEDVAKTLELDWREAIFAGVDFALWSGFLGLGTHSNVSAGASAILNPGNGSWNINPYVSFGVDFGELSGMANVTSSVDKGGPNKVGLEISVSSPVLWALVFDGKATLSYSLKDGKLEASANPRLLFPVAKLGWEVWYPLIYLHRLYGAVGADVSTLEGPSGLAYIGASMYVNRIFGFFIKGGIRVGSAGNVEPFFEVGGAP